MAHPTYYLNLCGAKLTDDQVQRIPMARLELATHITLKTTQAFGFLGGALVAPIYSLVRGEKDKMVDNSFDFAKNGMIVGLAVGPLLTAAFLVNKEYNSVTDRCYRIRLNKKVLLADRMSVLGAVGGLGAAHMMQAPLERGAVFGYIGGFFLGSVASGFL